MAVYLVDAFTAANLLFFNRWSGQVQPLIPFNIARWVFAGCIMLSWVLLVYRWIRAVRVMRSGVVAASYLDPLAVRVQSIRTGKNGRGWRRFLLFAELTKGRKGAEYVALFTYFSFEGKYVRLTTPSSLTSHSMAAYRFRRRSPPSYQRCDLVHRNEGQPGSCRTTRPK